jgi:hypothetical protein
VTALVNSEGSDLKFDTFPPERRRGLTPDFRNFRGESSPLLPGGISSRFQDIVRAELCVPTRAPPPGVDPPCTEHRAPPLSTLRDH